VTQEPLELNVNKYDVWTLSLAGQGAGTQIKSTLHPAGLEPDIHWVEG